MNPPGIYEYMKDKSFAAICFSHIGKRVNQEDNFFVNGTYLTPDLQRNMLNDKCYFTNEPAISGLRIYAVSDGMGGHNAGEVASLICVKELSLAQKKLRNCNSLTEATGYLQTVISEINTKVWNLSDEKKEYKGMGATLVLFVVCGKEYAVLNIGDSRAYYFNNEGLIQVTKDHTEGQRMLDLGILTRKELSAFPARKNINRYIGYWQRGYVLQADEFYPILDNGIILLCSDGITDYVSDTRISEILRSNENLGIIGKQLIDEAVSSNNADNATLILIPIGR